MAHDLPDLRQQWDFVLHAIARIPAGDVFPQGLLCAFLEF
jgi:hypothetical protein